MVDQEIFLFDGVLLLIWGGGKTAAVLASLLQTARAIDVTSGVKLSITTAPL